MDQLGVQISGALITKVTQRAARLAFLIEACTEISPSREIRDGGAQLIDRINEWLEEIKDLHEAQDDEVEDRIKSFIIRLKLAENKVESWPIPESAKAALRRKPARQGRRRGRRVKKAA